MKRIILACLMYAIGSIFTTTSADSNYDVLRPKGNADHDVKAFKSIHQTKKRPEPLKRDISLSGPSGITDTLTWRNVDASDLVNFGMLNHGDSLLVWLDPPAACSLLAIRFRSINWEGNLLLDIWDARNYDPLIYSTDSTDGNGWWGTFEPITNPNGWIPGDIADHSPLGMDAMDPSEHYWGPFPYTVTGAHADVWIEVPTALGIQGEIDLGEDPFYIGGAFYITDGWGFYSQYDWTTPYNFFKFYSAGEGPGPHDGWFIRQYFMWFEAIVRYYENTPPRYDNLRRQNWTYSPGPFPISVDIHDIDAENPSNAGIASAQLVYYINGSQHSTTMSGPSSGGTFIASIPSLNVGDIVTYHVSSFDFAGFVSKSSSITFGRTEPEHPEADILVVWDYTGDPDLDSFFVDLFSSFNACEYELWNVEKRNGIDASVINYGWNTIYVSGWGCGNTLPGFEYQGNAFTDWLDAGTLQEPHNLLYVDQDYFCIQDDYGCAWDEELIADDFLYDFFGIVLIVSDNHGADQAGYDSVAIGEGDFMGLNVNFLPDAWDPTNPENDLWPDWIIDLRPGAEQIFHYMDTEFGAGVRYNGGHFRTVFLPWQDFFAVNALWNGDLVPRPDLTVTIERIFDWFGTECGGTDDRIVLSLEHTCTNPGESIVIPLTLDNRAAGTVAVGQMVIAFNKSVFTVTSVNKTARTQDIDIFHWNGAHPNGLSFNFTGIGHSISVGTGPIAEITVDVSSGAANGNYDWKLSDIILADPLGEEYPFSTEDGRIQIPCGGADTSLFIGNACASPGETEVIQVILDNSDDGEVAAGEMKITFDTSVFTVTSVDKTYRSQEIDLFLWQDSASGIDFVFTGIGHSIAPGKGSIADITVKVNPGAANRNYEWCFGSPSLLVDPLGTEIPHDTECGTFQIPCGQIETSLFIGNACVGSGGRTIIQVNLNNSYEEVAGGDLTITFNTSVFTVISVDKTSRSQEMDLFLWQDDASGTDFVFTGIGHSIDPGKGPIADVTVEVDPGAANGIYKWCISSGSILANSDAMEIPHNTDCGIFQIPCGVCETPYVKASNVEGQTDEMVTVDVIIDQNSDAINAFRFDLTYDPTMLSFNRYNPGNLTGAWTNFHGSLLESGVIRIGGFNPTIAIPPQSSGSLATVTFQVTCSSCKEGDEGLLCIEELRDHIANMNVCCGSFMYRACERGNVNCDGDVTPGDALCCFWRSIEGIWQSECECNCSEQSADVNCDRDITPGDALCIFWKSIEGTWSPECQCQPGAKVAGTISEVVIGEAAVRTNRKVSVPIYVNPSEKLDAFSMDFRYPNDLLVFEKVSPTDATTNWIALNGVEIETGMVRIGGFDNEGMTAQKSIAILEVQFLIQDGAQGSGIFNVINLADDLTGASVLKRSISIESIPTSYALFQNSPNPFNPETEIVYSIPEAAYVTLKLYNTLGQVVSVLIDDFQEAGYHTVIWDASHETSGVYFYRLTTGDFTSTKRMVLMK